MTQVESKGEHQHPDQCQEIHGKEGLSGVKWSANVNHNLGKKNQQND